MRTHKDLEVWKRSMELVTKIYDITKDFPKEEMYGLTNQIRRSAVSLPSNISEGAARKYKKEFIQFLYISSGSLSEVETQLMISLNLSYINKKEFEALNSELIAIRSMLSGLIRSLEK